MGDSHMSNDRNIKRAALLSLLVHAWLLSLMSGSALQGMTALALSNSDGIAPSPNGDVGTLAFLLVSDESAASTTPAGAVFDVVRAEGPVTSTIVASVAESHHARKSPRDRLRPTDAAPAVPAGTASAVRHASALDRYSAQILGRIERAWVRPLAHVKEAFKCEARIAQTPQGEVREVTLTRCDVDPAWRESIVRAIRHAAPLPAPPSEAEFRSVLTLSFQSQPLSPALLAELLSIMEDGEAATQADAHDDVSERAARVRDTL